MERRSPSLSPSVVAQIFMIQKASVTCATLFMLSCIVDFLVGGAENRPDLALSKPVLVLGHAFAGRRRASNAAGAALAVFAYLEWCAGGFEGNCAGGLRLVAAPLDAVFQYLSGLGVHADFMHDRAVLDIEGIAQPAAAFFLLQFLGCDLAGKDLERNGTRFVQGELCLCGELFARKRPRRGKSRCRRAGRDGAAKHDRR